MGIIYTPYIIKSRYFYINLGFKFFLTKKSKIKEIEIYVAETKDICSIEKPKSIKKPNKAVPKAVAKTISAVVKALIDPMCLTPYISA